MLEYNGHALGFEGVVGAAALWLACGMQLCDAAAAAAAAATKGRSEKRRRHAKVERAALALSGMWQQQKRLQGH